MFTDLAMTTQINADNTPVFTATVFPTNSPVVYVTGVIKNAPTDTVAMAEWYYLETDSPFFIDSADMTTEFTDTSFNFSLSIPDNGWPAGSYEVKLYIDGKLKNTVAFELED
jgi:hypothetical protein